MSHSDTNEYRILNIINFRMKISYGYSKKLSDMDQELKNQHPLTSGACAHGVKSAISLDTGSGFINFAAVMESESEKVTAVTSAVHH